MASKLEAARPKSVAIFYYVFGFTGSLESAQSLDAFAYNFGKFKSWWESNRLNWRSSKVTTESANWTSSRMPSLYTALKSFQWILKAVLGWW
jgi:hypothetical protein